MLLFARFCYTVLITGASNSAIQTGLVFAVVGLEAPGTLMPLDSEFKLLLESLTTAVLLVDDNLNLQYLNPAAEVLLGVSRAQVIDSPLSTYVHEAGETIEIEADTAAFFPEGWKGVCTVHETVRKVYMIR